MNPQPRIHLVTFGTGIFRLRQWFLGKSALANRIVHTVTHWNPADLGTSGFHQRAPLISLASRGFGYWAWKPFIIEHRLSSIPLGDFVLYCDVGRRNNFKLLTQSLAPLIQWMEQNAQNVIPGVKIPWKGPMSMWTKRDAFILTGMDSPMIHEACPIQASFSLWRASHASFELASNWMAWCSDPRLVSDDKGACDQAELPDFRDHRHDQSLLTLVCLKHGIQGLDLGQEMPPIDTQHPTEVTSWMFQEYATCLTLGGRGLRALALPCELAEKIVRRVVHLG